MEDWEDDYRVTTDDFVMDEYLMDRGWEYLELEYGTSPDENIYFKEPKFPKIF